MKTKIYLTAVVMSAMALFSGCAKDGAVGPTGPQGPAGANGSSNVSSRIVSVTPGTWSNPQSGVYDVGIAMSALTDIDLDLVMVYIQSTNGIWASIPQANWLSNGDYIFFTYSSAGVEVFYTYSSAPSSAVNFKVVVIPPAARKTNSSLNLNNYEEVKTAFNLHD